MEVQRVTESTGARGTVLVIDDDPTIRLVVNRTLTRAGFDVIEATGGVNAKELLATQVPDVVLLDMMMPDIDGLTLLTWMREDASLRALPVLLLTAMDDMDTLVKAFRLGADDFITKPFHPRELVARVIAKLERPSMPSDLAPSDLQSGLPSAHQFWQTAEREVGLAGTGERRGHIAYLQIEELPQVHGRFGRGGDGQLARQLAALLTDSGRPHQLSGRDSAGRYLLWLPESDVDDARRQLESLSRLIVATDFRIGADHLRLTPVIGYARLEGTLPIADIRGRALLALEQAARQLDLHPVVYTTSMGAPRPLPTTRWYSGISRRAWQPFQFVVTLLLGVMIPFLIYTLLDRLGHDITPYVYIVVVVALAMTAALIWLEGLVSRPAPSPPREPTAPYPPASAIIAAYLPNEAGTIVETIEVFLRQDYPAPLQVILAYNTPRDLPIERTLREMAARDRRLVLLRVAGSTSKAQNVNAALSILQGEFAGVFDADHHPDPGSFERAWRWLSSGYDVVQGHCLVRNGDESWVARMIAVEFESIYTVSHPGRARLHGFGIFGGSNGYWKTETLRQTRMQGFMLTEDIDSSFRALEAGCRIASDPHLISRELAPATLTALWNQRMRWAQGWLQVTLRHAWRGMRSQYLSPRQKLGLFHLLAWREIYPWLSLQMFPIIAYWTVKLGSVQRLDWFVPIFVLTTLFTLTVGPGQAIFAYRNADPAIKQRRGWFISYFLIASIFYSEFKNVINRIAVIKQIMGDKKWVVTPRAATSDTPTASPAPAADPPGYHHQAS